jgi:hypothetical protein
MRKPGDGLTIAGLGLDPFSLGPIASPPFFATRLDSHPFNQFAQPSRRDRPSDLGLPTQPHMPRGFLDGPNLCVGQTFVQEEINRLAKPITFESTSTS